MLRCAGPIPHHRLPATNGTRGLRGPGFIPAVADCRYRAPLSPRLVRPCPTPTGIRQTLVPMIQHFPGRCKNFRGKIFARFGKKGFTFLELLVYYCVVQSIRACSSVGRAFGSHPRGQGFKSLQVHHTCGEQFAHRRFFFILKFCARACSGYLFCQHDPYSVSKTRKAAALRYGGLLFPYRKESIHSCTSRKKRER